MKIIEIIKRNRLLAMVGLAYVVLFIVRPDYAVKAVNSSVYYLVEMLEILPVIFLLTVIIEAWIPKKVIMKHLGEKSGITGKLFALFLGSVSAGPIYAAFPIVKTLLSKGASISNIVIILSSWAVIKVPMLANETKFLGAEFMVVRWILTVIMIFIMARITEKLIKRQDMIVKEDREHTDILEIRQDYCIGCGMCAKMLPEVYELNQKKAYVKQMPEGKKQMDVVEKTIETCPAQAIVFHREEIDKVVL